MAIKSTIAQTIMINFQELIWWHYLRHSIHYLSIYSRELLSNVQILRGQAE